MSKVNQIIATFFHHEFPEEVRTLLQGWLIHSGKAKGKDESLMCIWHDLDIPMDETTYHSFKQVQQKIQTDHSRIRMISRKIVRIAAVFLIPVLFIGGYYLYLKERTSSLPQEIALVEHFVPNGLIERVVLPDSTVVLANSGSVLIYPAQFSGGTRSVYLNGEANFEVTRDEKRPFIVKTTFMDIEALGTVFDVSSYPQNENISTTLQSGRVRVSLKNMAGESIDPIILEPHERVVYNRPSGKVEKSVVSDRYLSTWKYGHLVFQRAPLNDITTALEHKYDVTIYFNSSKYLNEKITVKFVHDETLQESLQILRQIVPGFRYRIEEKKVFLY